MRRRPRKSKGNATLQLAILRLRVDHSPEQISDGLGISLRTYYRCLEEFAEARPAARPSDPPER